MKEFDVIGDGGSHDRRLNDDHVQTLHSNMV